MSRKKRYQLHQKQKRKRKKRRKKLVAQKLNPDNFFYDGIWVRPKQ